MRMKIPQLGDPFTRPFDDHHRSLLARLLARIDGSDGDIALLDAGIEATWSRLRSRCSGLMKSPGSGRWRPR